MLSIREVCRAQLLNRRELSPVERTFVAAQSARGLDQARLLLLTQPGRSCETTRKLKDLGGEVHEDPDIDLLRVRGAIDKLSEELTWPELTAAEIDINKELDLLGLFSDQAALTAQGQTVITSDPKPGRPPLHTLQATILIPYNRSAACLILLR